MSKKKSGTLFNERGEEVYRFATPYKAVKVTDANGVVKWVGDPLVIYDQKADPEYAKLLADGRQGTLGELANGQGKKPGECFHTKEMDDRSVLAVGDLNGVIQTPDRNVALRILRTIDGAILDQACDQSLLDEVYEKKTSDLRTPAQRAKDALKEKESAAPVGTLKPKAPTV